MTHSFSSSTIIFAILRLLAASVGIPLVAAAEITTDDLYAKITPTAALPGFNAEGTSVFTNFVKAFNEEQLFWLKTGILVYERPESEPALIAVLDWCSDLTFSDVSNSSAIGYAGRCVHMFLAGYADLIASGGQLAADYSKEEFSSTSGISAVFVEQLNVFEGQYHSDTDDWVHRFWDDGRKTMPTIMWEGHDEGDMNPNAATSSLSGFVDYTRVSVDEVAQLLNTSVDEFTPEKFKQVHLDTWIKLHEKEAAEENPNPGPELEIIEQVKNETNYADDTATATSVESDGTDAQDDGGSDGEYPVEDDSGSGRQLVSVAARFVSAALRVFGI